MSFLNWKCPEWPYLIYDLEIPLKDVDPNSKESVLKFFRHIYSHLMEYYTTHSEDYDFPYPFNKEKTSAKLNSLFDREPINEAFDFENDKEDFDIDVRKVRTSLLVKELSELYNKLKQISPSPLWFLETKHGVVADILVKYGQNHEIISIPMARMKIGGKNVIISSEGTFKIGKAIRYGEMTPISEMPDNIYNQVISKMEDYIKNAKDLAQIRW